MKALTIIFALMLTGCGGAVLTSNQWPPSPAHDPAFLNYGLPHAYLPITIKRDEESLSVTFGAPIYVRDALWENNFRLNFHHEWYTGDTLMVQTDGAGLLAAVNTTSKNQIVPIMNQALALAGQVERALTVNLVPGRATKPPPCATGFAITYTFDPHKQSDIDELNWILASNNACVSIDGPASTLEDRLDDVAGAPPSCSGSQGCVGDGIFYRAARAYKIGVIDTKGETTKCRFVFTAPDPSLMYFMPLVRDWLVKFDVKLTFDRGVLTKFEASKPSQALAALQLPTDVIKSILGLDTPTSNSSVAKTK